LPFSQEGRGEGKGKGKNGGVVVGIAHHTTQRNESARQVSQNLFVLRKICRKFGENLAKYWPNVQIFWNNEIRKKNREGWLVCPSTTQMRVRKFARNASRKFFCVNCDNNLFVKRVFYRALLRDRRPSPFTHADCSIQ